MHKKLICSLLSIFFITAGCNKMEDTVTLVPEGYTGTVKIWFNQEDGSEVEYEDEKRVYRIPKNGVLNTKFNEQYGSHFPKFFYITDSGNRSEIIALPLLNKKVLDTLQKNKIYAYNFMLPGKGHRVDSLGVTVLEPGIIFTLGSPLEKSN